MVDAIAGDSNKVQAVVIGGKPDSTAPSTPPVTAGLPASVMPPVVGQPVTAASATATTGTVAPGMAASGTATPAGVLSPPAVVAATPLPSVVAAPSPPGTPAPATATAAIVDTSALSALSLGAQAELSAARSQLTLVRASMDSLAVEIQKKFALSFACIVFVLFGPPIALRFPRGGVGATLGISLVVFGLYYICLMAGETLADDGKLEPIIAMWIANVIFTIAGLLLLLRLEKTADASRGGGIRAWFEERRTRRANRRTVRVTEPTVAV